MLDHLSGGRLEIGLARGSSPLEAEAIGIPGDEMKPRFLEALDIVEGLLESSEPYNYDGKFYKCENLSISPRPLQQPSPPRWITVVTPESAALAGRRGYKICAGFMSIERVAAVFDAYRAAAAEAGRTVSPEDIAIRRLLVVDEDGDVARAAGKLAFNSPGDPEELAAWLSPDEIVSGTPDEAYAELVRQSDFAGAGNFLIYGGFPLFRERFEHTVELYGRFVLPRLRDHVSMEVAA